MGYLGYKHEIKCLLSLLNRHGGDFYLNQVKAMRFKKSRHARLDLRRLRPKTKDDKTFLIEYIRIDKNDHLDRLVDFCTDIGMNTLLIRKLELYTPSLNNPTENERTTLRWLLNPQSAEH